MADKPVKRKQSKPQGCRHCNGKPWIEGKDGQRRCTCPSGVWYQQQDRARITREPAQYRLEAM